jgi:hypothetical protein
MKLAFLVAMTLFAGLPVRAACAKPREVSDSDVQGCMLLSQVIGSSGYGKKIGWKSFAKANALKKAGAIGATHIGWKDFKPIGAFNGEAVGGAYLCTKDSARTTSAELSHPATRPLPDFHPR